MNKNRIRGAVNQGERACNRETIAIKWRRRRSGDCAAKVMFLTWGDLASCLKGRREKNRSEKSAEAVVVPFKYGAKGRMKRRA